jgi:hypothetical protein
MWFQQGVTNSTISTVQKSTGSFRGPAVGSKTPLLQANFSGLHSSGNGEALTQQGLSSVKPTKT